MVTIGFSAMIFGWRRSFWAHNLVAAASEMFSPKNEFCLNAWPIKCTQFNGDFGFLLALQNASSCSSQPYVTTSSHRWQIAIPLSLEPASLVEWPLQSFFFSQILRRIRSAFYLNVPKHTIDALEAVQIDCRNSAKFGWFLRLQSEVTSRFQPVDFPNWTRAASVNLTHYLSDSKRFEETPDSWQTVGAVHLAYKCSRNIVHINIHR